MALSKRCTLLVVAALLWVIVLSAHSLAGEYHVGDTLICSDCHVMHYSVSHGYSGDGVGFPPGTTGPYQMLLKNDPNDLCLSCHDGQGFAPDVRGLNTNVYVRQAGALNDSTTASSYPAWTGHTLGSTDVAPGGTWSDSTDGLLCVDCHAPHGLATQFRNLWVDDGDARSAQFQNTTLTFAAAQNDPTKDVFMSFQGSSGLDRLYGVRSIWFNEPDQTNSAYGRWCAACHKDFHGAGGDTNMGGASGGGSSWLRHPTADVDIGANADYLSSSTRYYSLTNRVKVMSPSGGTPPSGSGITPSCMSCHKAHGNKNPFGLIYMSGTGTVTEEGDTGGGQLTNLCRQCHVQGG